MSRHRAGARVALQQRPVLLRDTSIFCKTWRKSTKEEKRLAYRFQIAPRFLSARRETFDNQRGKDVKAKQHWCPLKQDHPIIGNLQQQISGEVLTDFLQLSKQVFDKPGDDAKNVAAVLAAALFEDTLRRLARANGIPHIESLQDVLTELKNKKVMQGTEVGIANSYLNFRKKALHAEWDKVERTSVASVHGFVEELLMKHFS